MKTFFTKILIVTICCFSALFVSSQCTNSPDGQWPPATFTPACSGVDEVITTAAWAGEYSVVNVTNGTMYTFKSSVATDYLTITNGDASTNFAFGVTPVIWTSTVTGTIRFFTHTNAACGTAQVNRSRIIQCGTAPPPPPPLTNDNCANAITLTPGATCVPTAGTTVGATQSIPAILCGGFSGTANDDVWYKFTATATSHTVTVVGSGGFDAVVDVRSGACNGTNIACADATFTNGTEVVNLTGLTIGNMYLIRVYHWFPAVTTGTFTICVTTGGGGGSGPANDLCANAISVTCGQTVTGTTVGSTQDNAGTCTTTNTSPGVWYTFIGNGQSITASLCGSGYDTKISVYTGSCGAFTCVAGNDDACGLQSQVSFLSVMGTTYRILVHGFLQNTGTFTLAVTCVNPPTNDLCANAISVACGQTVMGSTVGSSPDAAGTCGTTNTSPGVWYTIVGNGQVVTASLCGSAFNTKISVYTGSCGAFTCVAGNDNFCGLQSQVSFLSVMGTTYRILVHGSVQATGNFTLAMTCMDPLANDLCSGAIEIGCGESVSGTTVGSTADNAGTCGTTNTSPGVWYTVNGTGSPVTVTTCNGATFDTKISVFTGSCGALTCVGGNDDACGLQSSVTFASTTGTTYYILVHGFLQQTGPFTLFTSSDCILCRGPNPPVVSNLTATTATITWNSVPNATGYQYTVGTGLTLCPSGAAISTASTSANLTGLLPGTDYTICVRTRTCSNGNAPSGWSSLRFSTPGAVCDSPSIPVASAVGSTSATFTWTGTMGASYKYTIGTGFTCPNGAEVSAAGTSVTVTNLNPSTIYIFCVRTDCPSGAIWRSARITTLAQTTPPVNNDLCANAISIACGQTVSATTVGMTADVVPFCGTPLTTALGVWYNFVGTGQPVTASLCGSTYDTKIGVFTGTCGALVCVTGNDDFCGLQSQVAFATTLGTTYRILVTGFGTAAGAFTLALTCPPPAFAPTEITTENRSRSLNDVALYPNPAQDLINVRWGDAFTGKDVNIQVVNQLGQTVFSQKIYDVASEVETISLNNVTEGIYIMALHTDGQATIYKKFVVGVTRP